ncbi:hypothetical protein H8R18_02870 [Nanchangia anserum]|uniref:amino acid--tRNA ligase-related protein n=1 Tax=Nanchangia anserum TaxID=2692125 RepID=UPI001883FDEE|nr:amino acid--tRNA ligase-related protein [Nanchangia anserum]QOX82291.1 hypothetical protein H8R18_02870 [Nanchangia anserum]
MSSCRARARAFRALAERRILAERDFAAWRLIDLDIVTVTGRVTLSRSGEESIEVASWMMAAKALRPHPPRHAKLDSQTRTRERALALMTDASAMRLLRQRSAAVATIRRVLAEEGYAEVETPMLQAVQGGANARPFVTHLNAYSTDVFLRIAPELYLKRLVCGRNGRDLRDGTVLPQRRRRRHTQSRVHLARGLPRRWRLHDDAVC